VVSSESSASSAPLSIGTASAYFIMTIFVGLHTGISIAPGDKCLVPFVVSFIGAIGVLVVNAPQISDAVVIWFIKLLGIMIAIAVITSVQSGGGMVHHLLSSFLFIYAVGIGYATYVGLLAMGAERIEKTFFWTTMVLVIGAALELYGPMKPLSDGFRNIFDSWRGIYDSPFRDLMGYGAVRPSFFTSEPSYLGLDAGIAISLWLGAKRSIEQVTGFIAAIILIAALYLIRSPNVLFGPLALLLITLVVPRDASRWRRISKKALFALFIAAYLALPMFSFMAALTFRNLPDYMISASYFGRITAPFLVAMETLRTSPLLGIGIGNDEKMYQVCLQIFSAAGYLSQDRGLLALDLGRFLSNVFWQNFIFFGIGGVAIIIWLLQQLFKQFRTPVSSVLVFAISGGTFWQGIGGPNTPLAWFCFFLVAALCAIRQKHSVAVRR
jgi:hypothetical protein